ncbi:glutathione S-transferase [Cladophialophora yegresii CBS 114405]|uniref:Glutathione S-transferase n=1 Tax=Cladophialophora yegresii CBS 114405 TaxID=1182544 RepID=W9VLD0_9EURO|nr:glutathione S-transferase [Cladophialophora yegresii CBS 114405]EXJ56502.1 glutathione S-transferase [Cladophialophora yegresii CBS 114405]
MGDSRQTHQHADSDGHFRRKDSQFRNWISKEQGSNFTPDKDRYALYANYGCPWAHRTIIVRSLKSLEPVIQLITTDFDLTENGWTFTGRNGSMGADPLYGFTGLKQLYLKADPSYTGRYTVPLLWDKKTETIVNNESSEIIRMLYDQFDDFLEPDQREVNKPGGGFYPPHLRKEIDAMNEWVYNTVNNGVYKIGFAASQEAYDASIYPLFKSLDRLEEHLGAPAHQPYLFGEYITEADVRLYTTLARFDVAYYNIFNCNLKMIRHDYPRLSKWLRHLYWDTSDRTNGGVFKKTTFFEVYKYGYLRARGRQLHGGSDLGWPVILPRGPIPDIEPLTDEEEKDLINGTGSKLNGLTIADLPAGLNARSGNPFSAHGDKAGMGVLFGADVDSPVNPDDGVATPTTAAATTSMGSPASTRNGGDEVDDADALDENGEFVPRRMIKRRTTYSDANAKWYKAAKKAEKKAGAPPIHLAL